MRNDIAHRGLLLSIEQQRDVKYLDEQTKRLSELHLKARKQLHTLLNERAKLTGEPEVTLDEPS